MTFDGQSVTALVLAGARSTKDPVAQMAGVPNKVLAKVGGEPMVIRVLRTLERSHKIEKRILCGPSWEVVKGHHFLENLVDSGKVEWVEPQKGPSLSVRKFLDQHPQGFPLLITTADHALLTVEMVDYFLREAQREKVDVAVGLVPHSLVVSAYPHTKRTAIRFKGEGFCGCNLFMMFTPEAKKLVDFWNHIERERKHPLRLIRTLGGLVLVRYVLGWLSLSEALGQLSRRLDLHIKEILLPFPEAAIDVDTPDDLALVEKILVKRGEG
jgi:GTP:adenosylcobinamide-phosphate guanylyltransferase